MSEKRSARKNVQFANKKDKPNTQAKKIEKAKELTESQKEERTHKQKVVHALKLEEINEQKQQLEKKKQNEIIGQLKAAESLNRIGAMRLRFKTMRAEAINHMIASQPTARKAVRLECLLPPVQEYRDLKDTLDKLQRKRVEKLLDDELELSIIRIL
ncbi:protein LKAAEAR1 [Callorhinchus milii]|uniref:Uncharacterized protein n=1 Tax=Callorhinchus milii TaxID=7868 RepID=V9LA06_CALMI|nr:protein LKAAEAR1 [Callorhinchus milii]|eukprot:gi/632983489/ref/XP_007908672.1/ PREDICTED: protein LKAAEAR1 [Callorhinchus milii]